MTKGEANKEFDIRWKSQIKKGLIEYIIMLLLEKQTFYGYDLIDKIRTMSHIEIAEGTLYPLLNRLKKDGLVTSRWQEMESGIPRKYYTLTPTGKAQIELMNAYFTEIGFSLKKIKEFQP